MSQDRGDAQSSGTAYSETHRSNRGRPGQDRYKQKSLDVISFGTLQCMIESVQTLTEKSLLVILYYCGFREAEIVGDGIRKWKTLSQAGRVRYLSNSLPRDWMKEPDLYVWKHRGPVPGIIKEDINENKGTHTLEIYSKPLKHGKRAGRGLIELPISYPYVDLIFQQWCVTGPGERVWKMSTRKCWEVVQKASDYKLYPHAFRLSRATAFARQPKVSVAEMQQFFGWARASTADAYIIPEAVSVKLTKLLDPNLPNPTSS